MTKIFIKYLSLLNTFLIILSFFIYFNLKHKNTIPHKNSIEYSITISVKENLTRLEINNIIKKKKDEFIHLYGKFITDNEIAKVIINVSLSKDIPINIAISITAGIYRLVREILNILILNLYSTTQVIMG